MTRKRKTDRPSTATSSPIERQRKSSNETKPSSKPRPVRETASASDPEKPSPVVEHENSGSEPSQEQGSNGETQLVADSKRSAPDHVRSEGGLGAEQNPEFVHSAITFVHQEAIPAEYADAKPETRSAFESKAQALMETMRSANMSINEIAHMWKMSKAGVWNRVGHIEPKLTAQPLVQESPTNSTTPTSFSRPTNNNSETITTSNGGDTLGSQRQLPRANSEIFADRPRIVEGNQGYNGNNEGDDIEQTRRSVIVENNGGSSPVRVVVDPNSPYLQELLVQLLHLSAARNVPFKKYLETGMAVEDLRNANFAATLVPGETSEEFRRNLLSIAKKANLHDRYRVDAGLDGSEVEPQ